MAQQAGAAGSAPDRPESPPSPDFPIADHSAATTPVIADPLRYIATALKEVERGFDELNQGLGYTAKYGGRRTVRERDEEFQLSLSKILVTQQAQIKRLAGQVTGLSTAGTAEDKEEGEEEGEWEDHPLLDSLGLIEARLVEVQVTNVDQAADIHRVADTFEKFGELGDFVAWWGVWVRWVFAGTLGSVYAMIVAFGMAGVLAGVMQRQILANAANVTMAPGAEGASRVEFIVESGGGEACPANFG